ncbi:MAG: hypothetical protein KL785_08175 [Brevundimonas sp.]|nr:hypothetical protein [Brevundimonas sp.]
MRVVVHSFVARADGCPHHLRPQSIGDAEWIVADIVAISETLREVRHPQPGGRLGRAAKRRAFRRAAESETGEAKRVGDKQEFV